MIAVFFAIRDKKNIYENYRKKIIPSQLKKN